MNVEFTRGPIDRLDAFFHQSWNVGDFFFEPGLLRPAITGFWLALGTPTIRRSEVTFPRMRRSVYGVKPYLARRTLRVAEPVFGRIRMWRRGVFTHGRNFSRLRSLYRP